MADLTEFYDIEDSKQFVKESDKIREMENNGIKKRKRPCE